MKKLIILLSILLLSACNMQQLIKDLASVHPKEKRATMEDLYDIAEVPKNFNKVCKSTATINNRFYCNNRTMICLKSKEGVIKCYKEKQEDIEKREAEDRSYYLSGKAGRREEFYFYHKKYKNTRNTKDIDALLKYGRAIECAKVKTTQKPPLCNKKN